MFSGILLCFLLLLFGIFREARRRKWGGGGQRGSNVTRKRATKGSVTLSYLEEDLAQQLDLTVKRLLAQGFSDTHTLRFHAHLDLTR